MAERIAFPACAFQIEDQVGHVHAKLHHRFVNDPQHPASLFGAGGEPFEDRFDSRTEWIGQLGNSRGELGQFAEVEVD